MVSRPLRSPTLRELFNTSKHLAHDLTAHLDQNFVHSIHDVERGLRTGGTKSPNRDVGDVAAHNVISKALASYDFADDLSEQLRQALQSVRERAEAEISAESE